MVATLQEQEIVIYKDTIRSYIHTFVYVLVCTLSGLKCNIQNMNTVYKDGKKSRLDQFTANRSYLNRWKEKTKP